MSKIVELEGKLFEFPDDAGEQDIAAALEEWSRRESDTGEPPEVTLLKNTYRGFLGTYEAMLRGLQAMHVAETIRPTPSPYTHLVDHAAEAEKLGAAADVLASKSELLQPNPYWSGSFWMEKVPQGLGSTLAFLPASIAGSPGVAVAGLLANGGDAFKETLERTKDSEKAIEAFFWNGLGGITEAVPLAGLFKRIERMSKGSVSRAIAESLAQAGEEGVQEGIQTTLGNLVAIWGTDDDRKWYRDVLESIAVGGVVGGGMAVVGSAAKGLIEGEETPGEPPQPGKPAPATTAAPAEAVPSGEPGAAVKQTVADTRSVYVSDLNARVPRSTVFYWTDTSGEEHTLYVPQGLSFNEVLRESGDIDPATVGVVEKQSEGEAELASVLDYRNLVRELGGEPLETGESVPTPSGTAEKVSVGPSPIHGTGVFARVEFAPGAVIGPAFVEGKRTDTLGRYVNHATEPTAELLEDGTLRARRRIVPGMEITVNYRQAIPVMSRWLAAGKEVKPSEEDQEEEVGPEVLTPVETGEGSAVPSPTSPPSVGPAAAATPGTESVAATEASVTAPPSEPEPAPVQPAGQPETPAATVEEKPETAPEPQPTPPTETAAAPRGETPAAAPAGAAPLATEPAPETVEQQEIKPVEEKRARKPGPAGKKTEPSVVVRPPEPTVSEQPRGEESGVEPAQKPPEKSGDRLEEIRRRRAELEDELVRLLSEVSAGINPKLLTVAAQLAANYVEEGVVRFADFARRVANSPKLKDFWAGLKPYLYGAWVTAVGDSEGIETPTPAEARETLNQIEKETQHAGERGTGRGGPGEPAAPGTAGGLPAVEAERGTGPETGGVAGVPGRGDEQRPETEGERVGGRAGTERGAERTAEVAGPGESGRGGEPVITETREETELATGEASAPEETPPAPTGYVFPETDDSEWERGGAVNLYDRNVAAIRLAMKLESEGRTATSEEHKILAGYAGWGQSELANRIFDISTEGRWVDRRNELINLLGEEFVDGMRRSIGNALYTPPALARTIWTVLRRLGFRGGKVLEPSVGGGIFLSTMPTDLRGGSSWVINDLDPVSLKVASALHPAARWYNRPFEELDLPLNWFDLVITNVPFSASGPAADRFVPFETTLHDYFILKSLAVTRPGGYVAVITSAGTLDKENRRARRAMRDRADLVFAARLPANALPWTGVRADILLFRVRGPRLAPSGIEFEETVAAGELLPGTKYHQDRLNRITLDRPELVLGRVGVGSGLYAEEVTVLDSPPGWGERLRKLVDKVEPLGPVAAGPVFEPSLIPDTGRLTVEREPNGRRRVYVEMPGGREPALLEAGEVEVVADWLELRDALSALLQAELNDAPDMEDRRRVLRERYQQWQRHKRRLNNVPDILRDDTDYYRVASLELRDTRTGKWSTAPILDRRVLQPLRVPERVESVREAVSFSLAMYGRLDTAYLAKLTGLDEAAVVRELLENDLAYELPGGGLEYAPFYLYGEVRAKLEQARAAAALDPRFERNVRALSAVIPPDVPVENIRFSMASSWIPDEFLEKFLQRFFKTIDKPVKIKRPDVEPDYHYYDKMSNLLGTDYVTPVEVIRAALTGNRLVVIDRDKGLLQQETALANQKLDELNNRLVEYVLSDPDHRRKVERWYNDRFNSVYYPKFDGSFIRPPVSGMTPRPHQLSALVRLLVNRAVLLNHEVGTGKTLVYGLMAWAMKHFGIARRPMLAVLKANIDQVTAEIARALPTLRILSTAGRFDPERRRGTINRMVSGDYDLLIVTHDQLNMIDVPREIEEQFIRDEIRELEDEYRRYANSLDRADKKTAKQLAKRLEEAGNRLKKLLNPERVEAHGGKLKVRRVRDVQVDLKQLGVDALMVDEAHQYKSIPLKTLRRRTRGIPDSASKRGAGLLMRIAALRRMHPRAPVVMGTGTPIDNTLVELYVWLRHLMPDGLSAHGLNSLDDWLSAFTTTYDSLEPDVAGDFGPVTRLSFTNLPELMRLASAVVDTVRADEVAEIRRPRRVDHLESVPPTREQLVKMRELAIRAARIRSRGVHPKEDNMLLVCSDGRKLALHPGLVDRRLVNAPAPKLDRLFDLVAANHRAYPDQTHMVFCDLGVNPTEWGFRLYDRIIDGLAGRLGIPRGKVLDFSRMSEDEQAEAVARLRSGDALIGIGSTQRLGTGTNAQNRLRFLYHLDVPFTPGRLAQRDGRGWRDQNTNNEVHIYRLVTQRSLDAFMWSLVDKKARQIELFLRGENPVGELTDQDAEIVPPAVIMAEALGIPEVIESVQVGLDIQKLEARIRGFEYNRNRLSGELEHLNRVIPKIRERIPALEKLIETFEQNRGFSLEIGGRRFEKVDDAARVALLEAMRGVRRTGNTERVAIGRYRGATLLVSSSFHGTDNGALWIGDESGHSWSVATMRLSDDTANPLKELITQSGLLKRHLENERENLAEKEGLKESYERELETLKPEANQRLMEQLEQLRQRKLELDGIVREKRGEMLKNSENAELLDDLDDELSDDPETMFSLVRERHGERAADVDRVWGWLRGRHGIVPNGHVEVVHSDSDWDARVDIDEKGGVHLVFNAARIYGPKQLERALQHELAHVAWRSGLVEGALAALSSRERDAIVRDVDELGYTPDVLEEERQARAVQRLAERYRGRTWFGRLLGRLSAWLADRLGWKPSRRALEFIAAESLTNLLEQVRAGNQLRVLRSGAKRLESRTPEEAAADERPLPQPGEPGYDEAVKTRSQIAGEGTRTVPRMEYDALNNEAREFLGKYADTVDGDLEAWRAVRVMSDPVRRQFAAAHLAARVARRLATDDDRRSGEILQAIGNTLLRDFSRAGQQLNVVAELNRVLEPSLPALSLYSPVARRLRRRISEMLGQPVESLHEALTTLLSTTDRSWLERLLGALQNNPAALTGIIRLLADHPVSVELERRVNDLRKRLEAEQNRLSLRELYVRQGVDSVADAVLRLLLGVSGRSDQPHLLAFDRAVLTELRRITLEVMEELGFKAVAGAKTDPAERLAMALSRDPQKQLKAERILAKLREKLGDNDQFDVVLEELLRQYAQRVVSRRSVRQLLLAVVREMAVNWREVFTRRQSDRLAVRLHEEVLRRVRSRMSPGSVTPAEFDDLVRLEVELLIGQRRAAHEAWARREAVLLSALRGSLAGRGLTITGLLRMSEPERERAWEEIRRGVVDSLGELGDEARQQVSDTLDRLRERYRLGEIRRELGRLGLLPTVLKPAETTSLLQRVLEWGRLGLFELDVFVAELAARLRLKVPDRRVFQEMARLGEQAARARRGVERNRLHRRIIELLHSQTEYSPHDLLRDWWYAAVLQRSQTWANVVVGSGTTAFLYVPAMSADRMMRGDLRGAGEILLVFATGLARGARMAGYLIRTGDYSVLPDYGERFERELKRYLAGGRARGSSGTLEALDRMSWRDLNVLQKAARLLRLKYTHRIMTGLDYIFSSAAHDAFALFSAMTREDAGALAALRRRWNREEMRRLKREAVRALGEDAPVAVRDAWVRDRLEDKLDDEARAEINYLAQRVAQNADLRGVWGVAQRFFERIPFLIKAPIGAAFMRAALNLGASFSDMMVGAFRAWVGYRASRVKHVTDNPFRGWANSPEERRIQVMLNLFGLGLAAFWLYWTLWRDDDDPWLDLEGPWSVLDARSRRKRMEQGAKPLSVVLKRPDGRKFYISYRNTIVSPILGTVGYLRDLKRYRPDVFDKTEAVKLAAAAILTGFSSVKDVAALGQLAYLTGISAYYVDTPESMFDFVNQRMATALGRTVQGFVPGLVGELDQWLDPRMYRTYGPIGEERVLGYWIRHFPFLRRVSPNQPALNILGEEVSLEPPPLKQYLGRSKTLENDAWDVLEYAAGLGVFPPAPSENQTVTEHGEIREMTGDEFYRYFRAWGELLRRDLELNAPRLLISSREQLREFFHDGRRNAERRRLARIMAGIPSR